MKYLLDTHIVLMITKNPPNLSVSAKTFLLDESVREVCECHLLLGSDDQAELGQGLSHHLLRVICAGV